jgi:2-keto-3-deoxy-L-rhamnonate aldolase RhmA
MTTQIPTTGASRRTRTRSRSVSDQPPASTAEHDFILTLWTDDTALAQCADAAGIDRIGLDLEWRGKSERQAGLGTRISLHEIECLPAIRDALSGAKLFARVNPLGPETPDEVEQALGLGVDVLMLPMFERASEVARFCEVVGGRATVVPLLETRAAAEATAEIVAIEGVDEVHIGINDLALSLGLRSRFEVLDSPLVQRVADAVRDAGLRLGIGGIGRAGDRSLPIASDLIYAQYPRLGATAALISRAFIVAGTGCEALALEVARARERLAWWEQAGPAELERARLQLRNAIADCKSW